MLFCIGNFLPSISDKYRNEIEISDKLEEFYQEILTSSSKSRARSLPIDTYFIDSTNLIAPFMNSRGMHQFNERLHFLGRAGVHQFEKLNGLRIAFLSGKDSEIFGAMKDQTGPNNQNNEYTGKYFLERDVKDIID